MKKFRAMRPEGIYEKVLRQRKIDGIKFYEENSKSFVEVDCPACNSKRKEEKFEKWGYNHCICQECSTLYCSPRPTDKQLGYFYNSYEAPKMWTELLVSADVSRKKNQYSPRAEKLLKLMNKASKCGVAIDVGAGSGAFALALKDTEVFEDVIALDLSEDCVNTCKKSGLTGVKGVINDMDDNYAELICMNDLIEHVYDPLELVLECRRVIKEGGYLQIATPNGEGFDFRILKEETKNITPPEHINYFNTSSIEVLLKRAGFKEIIVETPGMLDVDIILNEIKNGLSLKNNNEYLEYLMNQDEKVLSAFQKFLSDNKLSSHMLIVAKK